MHSDIESDEDWGDGPLKSAPNPNKKYYKEKQEDQYSSLPPTRQWPVESCNNVNYNYRPQSDTYGSQYASHHPTHYVPPPPSTTTSSRHTRPGRAPSPTRPGRIEKVSCQVSATNQNGEVVLEQEAIFEDDMEVYRSTAYKKKMKRLQKLQERTNKRGLESAKNIFSTRFVLTKVDPDLTVEDIEYYILNFLMK